VQLGAGAIDVAQIIPEVRERLADVPEPPALDSEDARFRLFDSTVAFIRNAGKERPWVLVLDDLHAADEPSLLLLRFLAGELVRSSVLVVGTYRDVDPTVRDPLASTLTELARERVTRRLNLTGLTQADVGRYIELETGAMPSADLVRAIHEETEGNPLFVGEVVRLLAAGGDLAGADSKTLSTLGIPQGVREVIGRRLRSLSEESSRVLSLASVLGREFRVDALGRVAELPGDDVFEALDDAVAASLVTPVPGGLGRFRFAHALIRDTLYDDLTTPRRVLLHRRTAEALEDIYAGNPEPHLAELTHHYFEAAPGGDVDKALAYARRTAARSLELLAFEEAARFYELALQTLELKAVDATTHCELLLGLGEARAREGNEAAAQSAFLRAAEIARSARSAEQLARAALGYGGRFVWMVSGLDEGVVPLLDDALNELGDQETALRAKVLARLAGALRDQPEPRRRTELSAQAVATARRLEDRSALAYALDGSYCAVWGPENPDERLGIAEELLTVSSVIGDRERSIQGHYYRALALLELCRIDEVHSEVRMIDRLVTELRQPAQRWYLEVLRGILALLEGDFVEAREAIPRGFQFARTLRSRLSPVSFQLQTLMLDRERGELDEGITAMEQAVEEMPTLTVFSCILANLCAEGGRDTEARRILERQSKTEFDVLPDNDKLYGWALLAEVCSALGDPVHGPKLYELLLPYAERNVVCHPGCATGSVSRYLGLLATLLGRFEDGSSHFEDALVLNARMGARPWLAHTQEDYARLLLERGEPGDREKAQTLLDAAVTTYRELDMTGPLRRAESAVVT
jgi:tetratricopeptide (TPR) repeat protein